MSDHELRVSKIKDGTVIDHINAGCALEVIRILGITGHEKRTMTIAINVPSKRLKTKDIIKIEGRALDPQEVNTLALVAPHATINLIRNYEVVKKLEVTLPHVIENIVKCTNPSCVSNSNEPIKTKFYVQREEPLLMMCHYCSHILEETDILQQF
jgi:aspartate carbamoyltransferase regulatory subunit